VDDDLTPDDEGFEGEVLWVGDLEPGPYYYEVIVTWADDEPSAKELRSVRALWPSFADLSLREFRRTAAASRTLSFPKQFGREDATNLVDRGRAWGLDIEAHGLDEESSPR